MKIKSLLIAVVASFVLAPVNVFAQSDQGQQGTTQGQSGEEEIVVRPPVTNPENQGGGTSGGVGVVSGDPELPSGGDYVTPTSTFNDEVKGVVADTTKPPAEKIVVINNIYIRERTRIVNTRKKASGSYDLVALKKELDVLKGQHHKALDAVMQKLPGMVRQEVAHQLVGVKSELKSELIAYFTPYLTKGAVIQSVQPQGTGGGMSTPQGQQFQQPAPQGQSQGIPDWFWIALGIVVFLGLAAWLFRKKEAPQPAQVQQLTPAPEARDDCHCIERNGDKAEEILGQAMVKGKDVTVRVRKDEIRIRAINPLTVPAGPRSRPKK